MTILSFLSAFTHSLSSFPSSAVFNLIITTKRPSSQQTFWLVTSGIYNIKNGCIPFRCAYSRTDIVHAPSPIWLTGKHNRMEPLLTLLVTFVLFLLWPVKMSAVKRVYTPCQVVKGAMFFLPLLCSLWHLHSVIWNLPPACSFKPFLIFSGLCIFYLPLEKCLTSWTALPVLIPACLMLLKKCIKRHGFQCS